MAARTPGWRRTSGDALRRGEELVREVEAGHDQRAAVAEHRGGRLGVGPDVELGDGRAVAERATAHDRDPADPRRQIRGDAQGEGDVGQRADADDPDALDGAARLDDEADGVVTVERPGGRRELGPVEAADTVHGRRRVQLGDQRASRPAVHGHVGTEQLTDGEGVVGGALERGVAGDGRDAEQLGVARRDDDGDGVVVPRVAVEDHRHRHRRSACHDRARGRIPELFTPADRF